MAFKFTPIKEVKIEERSSLRSSLYDYTFPKEESYVYPYTHNDNEESNVIRRSSEEGTKILTADCKKEIKALAKRLTKLKNNH